MDETLLGIITEERRPHAWKAPSPMDTTPSPKVTDVKEVQTTNAH